ncbi:TPA: glycosyltransferase [Enterobacter hormaechei]|nr:glycosyltransferase [Enterobacter hormaechei]HBL6077714.1 glycosyltransferase [Enterobacter hormaechei]HBL8959202.1 glycosyltransferase [Enterobacter hormaechei]HBL9076393.1 glycosyltransferase [Enterobacter hormaechei]
MLLSIIIPTYNSENFIGKTLNSIKIQGFSRKDLEVIIVDGLSSDDTVEISKSYGDLITTIIQEKDSGIYDAMNKGILAATGKYCYFIGAGDTLIDNSIARILPELDKFNGLIYGNVIRTKSGQVYDGKFNFLKLLRRNICHQAIFYPAKVLKKHKYDLKYRVLADYHLNLILFAEKNLPRKFINVNVAFYDDQSQGFSSTQIDQAFLNDYESIIESNYTLKFRLLFKALMLSRKIKKALK